MTNTINTQNNLQSPAIKADSQAKSNTDSANISTANKAHSGTGAGAGAGTGAAAIVELNHSNILQDLNHSIKQLPETNAAKVESIKDALARGEYQPDAELIAKKFSEIERLLP